MKNDIIIIGAGAAGLMAATELLQAGYHVCLLEATSVAGGRIATIQEIGFTGPVETGAEFIHGNLPLTLTLLEKAGISYTPVTGKMITIQQGDWQTDQAHDSHWQLFMRRLGKLNHDMTLATFLEENFSDEKYRDLRNAVQHFAEGFDLADTTKASALAALREWAHEQETQYRIPGGYSQLVNYLLQQCRRQQATIHFNCAVTSVHYDNEGVTIATAGGITFKGAAVIITVSAGVLQSDMISFTPSLDPSWSQAIQQLGFGSVIKILLQFEAPFWKTKNPDAGFLLSNETIPTWWTQLPIENNLLTGWLGGPAAMAIPGNSDAEILKASLQSLAGIFTMDALQLRRQLLHYKICNWHQHHFAKGGYSFVTVDSVAAKKILAHPAGGVVYFAGEAFYRGESQGTVEAALQSGLQVSAMIKEVMAAPSNKN